MSKIDWHAGFVPAMMLELREYEDDLEFKEEYHIDNRGHRIDLLIIKNNRGLTITRQIGMIFDKFNIIEYKSPDDTLDYGALFNTISHACLYLRDNYVYNLYCRDAFTVTAISSGRPRKLLKQLRQDGIAYTETESGILVIDAMMPFKTQIIIINELSKEYSWLRKLCKKADKSDLQDLLDVTATVIDNPKHKRYADSVADVFFMATGVLNSIKKEDVNMCKSAEEFFAEWHKEEIEELNNKLAEQGIQLSKKDAQIKKLKAQIAKLQKQTAIL